MVPDLYAIDDSGSVSRLEKCPSGGEDLRRLLERNPGLLPGAQSEAANGWLLVGRNLRPAPPYGDVGWSVDYLFVDREGVPTFVDCKNPLEARGRHEAIGQMLEYVATAQTSWEANDLWEWLTVEQEDAEGAVAGLLGDSNRSPGDFLGDVLEKLRAGVFRLVFLVGDAGPELQRVIAFLNRQMNSSQVFVFEARQYRAGGVRILAPAIFGPGVAHSPVVDSEAGLDGCQVELEPADVEPGAEFEHAGAEPGPELGQAAAQVETELEWETGEIDGFSLEGPEPEPEESGIVNEESYFEEVENRLAGDQVRAVRTFYEVAQKLAFNLEWRNGDGGASLEVYLARISDRSLLNLGADGTLTLNFGALAGDLVAEGYQQRFRSIAHNRLDLVVHLDEMNSMLRPIDWCPKLTGVLRVLDDLASMAGQASAPSAV